MAWEQDASMTTVRRHAAAGVLDGKFYVAGGEDENDAQLSSVEVLDPATGEWSDVAPMTTVRFLSAAGDRSGVLDDKFYVAGGMDADRALLSRLCGGVQSCDQRVVRCSTHGHYAVRCCGRCAGWQV